MAEKWSSRHPSLAIFSYLKDSAFTAVKGQMNQKLDIFVLVQF